MSDQDASKALGGWSAFPQESGRIPTLESMEGEARTSDGPCVYLPVPRNSNLRLIRGGASFEPQEVDSGGEVAARFPAANPTHGPPPARARRPELKPLHESALKVVDRHARRLRGRQGEADLVTSSVRIGEGDRGSPVRCDVHCGRVTHTLGQHLECSRSPGNVTGPARMRPSRTG